MDFSKRAREFSHPEVFDQPFAKGIKANFLENPEALEAFKDQMRAAGIPAYKIETLAHNFRWNCLASIVHADVLELLEEGGYELIDGLMADNEDIDKLDAFCRHLHACYLWVYHCALEEKNPSESLEEFPEFLVGLKKFAKSRYNDTRSEDAGFGPYENVALLGAGYEPMLSMIKAAVTFLKQQPEYTTMSPEAREKLLQTLQSDLKHLAIHFPVHLEGLRGIEMGSPYLYGHYFTPKTNPFLFDPEQGTLGLNSNAFDTLPGKVNQEVVKHHGCLAAYVASPKHSVTLLDSQIDFAIQMASKYLMVD